MMPKRKKSKLLEGLINEGMTPEDMILYLEQTIKESRKIQESNKLCQSYAEQIQEEIRLHKLEYFLLVLKKEHQSKLI